jgi:hypothetical protein
MRGLPSERQPMKPPAGRGRPILYLDFDGVLHHEDVIWQPRRGAYMNAWGHRLFEHVQLLEQLLAEVPQVAIVLSTSWVRQYGFSRAAKRLGPALRARCIGSTWHSGLRGDGEYAFLQQSRGLQVIEDVRRREPAGWVAVDDDHGDWPPAFEQHLVRSNAVLGIGHAPVFNDLRDKLHAIVAQHRGQPRAILPKDIQRP